jgi:hypothetical protein
MSNQKVIKNVKPLTVAIHDAVNYDDTYEAVKAHVENLDTLSKATSNTLDNLVLTIFKLDDVSRAYDLIQINSDMSTVTKRNMRLVQKVIGAYQSRGVDKQGYAELIVKALSDGATVAQLADMVWKIGSYLIGNDVREFANLNTGILYYTKPTAKDSIALVALYEHKVSSTFLNDLSVTLTDNNLPLPDTEKKKERYQSSYNSSLTQMVSDQIGDEKLDMRAKDKILSSREKNVEAVEAESTRSELLTELAKQKQDTFKLSTQAIADKKEISSLKAERLERERKEAETIQTGIAAGVKSSQTKEQKEITGLQSELAKAEETTQKAVEAVKAKSEVSTKEIEALAAKRLDSERKVIAALQARIADSEDSSLIAELQQSLNDKALTADEDLHTIETLRAQVSASTSIIELVNEVRSYLNDAHYQLDQKGNVSKVQRSESLAAIDSALAVLAAFDKQKETSA